MGSTYASLHYHFVFSTKHRAPLITSAIRTRLHEYVGGTVRSLEGVPEMVGGVEDHIHILASLKPTHCLSDFMRDLKKGTTHWMKNEMGAREFAWQDGYAAFTVGATSRGALVAYINGQEAHHRRVTFKDELIAFLKQAGVAYDPKYLD